MKKSPPIIIILFLLLSAFTLVEANVDREVEWKKVDNQEKKEIHYCFDDKDETSTFKNYDKDGKWKGWIEEAVREWNNANTGWKFIKVEQNDPKCQVTIELDPELMYLEYKQTTGIHELYGKCGEVTWSDRDPTTKRFGKATVKFLPYLNKFYCKTHGEWETHQTHLGTEGADKIDPRSIAKHELGHLLRINHPPLKDGNRVERYRKEDVMWWNTEEMKGEHPRRLSAHDIEEAKESIKNENRGVAMIDKSITKEGGVLVYLDPEVYPGEIKCIIEVPPEVVKESTTLRLSILDSCILPPRRTPGELEIFSAIEVEVIDGETPNTMIISIYYGDLPVGPEYPTGIYIDFPAIVEDRIRPFEYVEMGWNEISEYILDTDKNMVKFIVRHASIFGLGGSLRPVMTIKPPVGGFIIPAQRGSPYKATQILAFGMAVLGLSLAIMEKGR